MAKPMIPQCKHNHKGHPTEYHPKWDGYFCRHCNEWLEPTCNDPKCIYCMRPPTPLNPDGTLAISI